MRFKYRKLLHRSFEGTLHKRQQRVLNQELAQNADLRNEQTKLEYIRNTLANTPEPSFRTFFAERVTHRIMDLYQQGQNDFAASLVYAFRRIAIAGVITAIILLSVNLFTPAATTTSSSPGVTTTLDDMLDPGKTTSLEDVL